MIDSFKCIKNLGPFKSIEQVKLAKTTLIFAENGSGKTMLSEAFRSMATGQPDLVAGRARLGADGGEPLVVFGQAGASKDLVWGPKGWKGGVPKIAVFNDGFIEANVYSGLEVGATHRQGLHSVAVGAEGIRKAQSYTQAGADVTAARRSKDDIAKAIQNRIGNEFKAEDFVDWKPCPDIDARIAKNQEALKVALNADQIRLRSQLMPLPIPRPDLETVRSTLSSNIDDMVSDVSREVNAHLSKLWDGAQSWVYEGWSSAGSHDTCPYCGQSLANSQLVDLFKHYFGERYQDAKNQIEKVLLDFETDNDESSRLDFMAVANRNVQLLEQWKADGLNANNQTRFDAEAVVGTWQELTAAIIGALKNKLAAPIDGIELDEVALGSMERFRRSVSSIKAENNDIAAVNTEIDRMKTKSEHGDVEALKFKARELQCLQLRGEPEIAKLCSDYESARTAWEDAQVERETRRNQMSQHNAESFRRYGRAINEHLDKFGAGFRIRELKEVAPGGVVTSEFVIAINEEEVRLKSMSESASFGNTLSGGDRAALALAFFFASLDLRQDLCESVVVIDDPLSSLDEGRRSKTVSAIRRYATDAAQMILLSHDKAFLCQLQRRLRSQFQVAGLSIDYEIEGSTIVDWNLEEACRRDEEARGLRMQRFVNREERASTSLFRDIRQHLENYLTLAYPSEFTASSGVGDFLGHHERENGLYYTTPLLNSARVVELRDLHDYSSDELHWNIVTESAQRELRSQVRRTLEFCRGQTGNSTLGPD